MMGFRHADRRLPFLWEGAGQPAARWNAQGKGPVHYFADTPDGAWAELLRHEEITDPADAATIRRALWAVEIGEEPLKRVHLHFRVLIGDRDTYWACQAHARRLRTRGARRLVAPSAALMAGGAAGRQVANGVERGGPSRDARVIAVFGPPDRLVGWKAADRGAPPADILPHVRHFKNSPGK
jgi:hypothetical protein